MMLTVAALWKIASQVAARSESASRVRPKSGRARSAGRAVTRWRARSSRAMPWWSRAWWTRSVASAWSRARTVQTISAAVSVRSRASRWAPTKPVAPVSRMRRRGPSEARLMPGRMPGSRAASARRAGGSPAGADDGWACSPRKRASAAAVGYWKSQATRMSRPSSTPSRLAAWMAWRDWAPRSKTSSSTARVSAPRICRQTPVTVRSRGLPVVGAWGADVSLSAARSIFPEPVRGSRSRNSTPEGSSRRAAWPADVP